MCKTLFKLSLGWFMIAGFMTPAGAVQYFAPLGPWGTNLSVMNGSNPNGDWLLFLQDDKQQDVGSISKGWYVTLTTANPVGFAADNQIFSAPAASSLTVGALWKISLAVTNYGPSGSTNICVTNTLPAGLALVSNTPTAGSVSLVGSLLTWNLTNLPVDTGATLSLCFSNGAAGVAYTNAAGIASAGVADPNPDDDAIVATATFSAIIAPQIAPMPDPGSSVRTGFQFSISASPSGVIIQASTNLNPNGWVNLSTNYSPTNFIFTDLNSTSYPVRFYRAVPVP